MEAARAKVAELADAPDLGLEYAGLARDVPNVENPRQFSISVDRILPADL